MPSRRRSAPKPPVAAVPKRQTHIISNMAYVKHAKQMLGTLKYLQYRDDRNGHIPHLPDHKPKRWIDHGMGDTYRTILHNCEERESKDVLAWTYVISPDPIIMELVPERKRRALLEHLTEGIVEEYYEARDEWQPVYSFVIHDREAATGKQQLHSHIILPGTTDTMSGSKPYYNNRRDGHIDLFNQLAEEVFERELSALGIQIPRTLEPEIAAEAPEVSEPEPPETERTRLIAEILDQWDWNF